MFYLVHSEGNPIALFLNEVDANEYVTHFSFDLGIICVVEKLNDTDAIMRFFGK